MDVVNVHLPWALLAQTAVTAGLALYALRFLDARPVSAAMACYWRRSVEHVLSSVLREPVTAASPLVVASARRLLADAALAVFPNTTLTVDPPGPAPSPRRR